MFDKIGITQAPFLNVDIFLPTITKFECRFTSAILSNNIVSFFIILYMYKTNSNNVKRKPQMKQRLVKLYEISIFVYIYGLQLYLNWKYIYHH